jgi:SAM-dependent methyltransferase
MTTRWSAEGPREGDAYDERWVALAQSGADVHGEANLVAGLGVRSVLDAGCGTGRVAIELARRGFDVVGVDLDARMLATAQRKAPALTWIEADLATVDLGRRFDGIVAAGNVFLFVAAGSEDAVLANLARHLAPGGVLVAGFSLGRGLDLATYDALAVAAGLELVERWATWERDPWQPDSDYGVSVHALATTRS